MVFPTFEVEFAMVCETDFQASKGMPSRISNSSSQDLGDEVGTRKISRMIGYEESCWIRDHKIWVKFGFLLKGIGVGVGIEVACGFGVVLGEVDDDVSLVDTVIGVVWNFLHMYLFPDFEQM